MDSYRRIATLKIQSAQDRAHAIVEEIRRIENKVYASPGSKQLLKIVEGAAIRLQGLLEDANAVPISDVLSAAELELRLDRTTKLIPYLHMLLGFVDGSDVQRSPGQLIRPLRRYVRSIIPASEIVLRSKAELNYSIQDIAEPLRRLADQLSLKSSSGLPDRLFVVNIPAVESGQILIHGILAHELGHALYKKNDLAGKLLPDIRVNEALVKAMSEAPQPQGPPPGLRLREWITEQVTSRITGWVRELSSDAIGIRLFGPALFFAEVHLMTGFKHIDQGSVSHPPNRLRVKLMMRMLKQLYAVDKLHQNLQVFLRSWDEVSVAPIMARSTFDKLALESVSEKAIELIIQASATAVPEPQSYTATQFDKDVAELSPLFMNYIPPGETGPCGRGAPVELASIINAGWYVYLCDFETFRIKLHAGDSGTRFAAATKLHELVLKALEISEMKTAWEEARHDSKCGTN